VSSKEGDFITWGAMTLDLVNTRSSLLDTIDAAKEASVDYYLFVQSAYSQYREGVIYDKGKDMGEDDGLEETAPEGADLFSGESKTQEGLSPER
jgi:ABC-type transporter lipoprotein component MlaA